MGETELAASPAARFPAANGDANSGVSSEQAAGAEKVGPSCQSLSSNLFLRQFVNTHFGTVLCTIFNAKPASATTRLGISSLADFSLAYFARVRSAKIT